MFSHVMLGVNDLEASKKFYDALLGTLGIGPGIANRNRYFYRSPTGSFAITTPINGEAATHGMRLASPTAAPPAKSRRGFATARWASCTWPTCATRMATSSVRCTGRRNKVAAFLVAAYAMSARARGQFATQTPL
jgi:hypothetical protein